MSLSGGMRQRVMIAMALVCEPRLLIADEPTTALDVTIQAQIMDLLLELGQRTGTAILFITHNLGLVAESCARMLTMYAGQVVEDGPVDEILSRPLASLHGRPARLAAAGRSSANRKLPSIPGRVPSPREMPAGCRFAPRCTYVEAACRTAAAIACARRAPRALLASRRSWLCRERRCERIFSQSRISEIAFPGRRRVTRSSRPSMASASRCAQGETFGVIGESGSGKSTLGRCVVCLLPPSSGRIVHAFRQGSVCAAAGELRQHRRTFQIIFQDPNAALDPRMTILDSVREPLDVAGIGTSQERRRRALAMLDRVALSPELAYRYPHEISGGQKQRANIARALVLEPTPDRVRRGRGGARRVDPGRHAQPVRRPAARVHAHLRVHQP